MAYSLIEKSTTVEKSTTHRDGKGRQRGMTGSSHVASKGEQSQAVLHDLHDLITRGQREGQVKRSDVEEFVTTHDLELDDVDVVNQALHDAHIDISEPDAEEQQVEDDVA